jgi:hypothetical protein
MCEGIRATGLEDKMHTEGYARIPSGFEDYRVVRYVVRTPARDRYVRRRPIETREEAVEEYIYQTLIYGMPRASRYGLQ